MNQLTTRSFIVNWVSLTVTFIVIVPNFGLQARRSVVDSSWNVMAHGDARKGKWRGNWRMQWVASALHTTSEHGVSSITTAEVYPALLPLMRTPRLPVVDWTDPPPADLNGLVRFAERRNLVSARVSSHFNWPLHQSAIPQHIIISLLHIPT